jgi:hypothetical protein
MYVIIEIGSINAGSTRGLISIGEDLRQLGVTVVPSHSPLAGQFAEKHSFHLRGLGGFAGR